MKNRSYILRKVNNALTMINAKNYMIATNELLTLRNQLRKDIQVLIKNMRDKQQNVN